MRAQALRPSDEMKLMRRAVIENNHAFDPNQIRAPRARTALESLFRRHQSTILETGTPSFTDLSSGKAPGPHFHATLLAAALLAQVLCPFYRNRSSLDFLHPNGLTREKDDRNFTDALLIMNKTCDSA